MGRSSSRKQGNRNPLIDHLEWAERIDFTLGLGRDEGQETEPAQPATVEAITIVDEAPAS